MECLFESILRTDYYHVNAFLLMPCCLYTEYLIHWLVSTNNMMNEKGTKSDRSKETVDIP